MNIFMIGGTYLPHYMMNIGPEAQESLRQYRFNISFFGCTAVDLADRFAYVTNTDSLHMKHIAFSGSEKKVLLLDETKLGKRAFLRFSPIDDFDHVYCDRNKSKLNDSKIEFISMKDE